LLGGRLIGRRRRRWELPREPLKGRAPPFGRAQVAASQVGGDADQEPFEGAVAAEACGGTRQCDEYVMHQILGSGVVAE
jgi:hypothetical protein